jgi:hypothetical protein
MLESHITSSANLVGLGPCATAPSAKRPPSKAGSTLGAVPVGAEPVAKSAKTTDIYGESALLSTAMRGGFKYKGTKKVKQSKYHWAEWVGVHVFGWAVI